MYWPFWYIFLLISQVNQIDSITCNKRGSTNKSPTKLNAAENKFDTGNLFSNRENYRGKTPPGEFKIITPKNIHYYQNKLLQVKGIQVRT